MKATYQLCVPAGGAYPGELHEACHSYIDRSSSEVVIVVRHLASGECSAVPSREVDFEVTKAKV